MPMNVQSMLGAASSSIKPRRIVALSAAMLMLSAEASFAANATLLTSSLCVDPGDAVNYYWAREKYGAEALFLMKNDGTIVKIAGANDFNDYDQIYISAHGSKGHIEPFGIDDFINHFHTAHPLTPALLYFESCDAAMGPESNMKKFNEEYDNMVTKLEGPEGVCQLVGNGNSSLTDAEYKYDANQSDQDQFNQIEGNIENDWIYNSNYQGSGMSFKNVCDQLVTQSDGQQLLDFVNETYNRYTTAAVEPIDTTINYLELIKLNTGGKDFLVCGDNYQDPCP